MERNDMAENKAKISYDDFVTKVVKDPKQPPDTILLTGYVGESSEEGHSRIYFDPQLTQYVEVPHDAVLHTQPIPKENSSLGGYHIWIKRDAELIHGKVGPERTKARFFEGPIGAQAAAAHGAGIPVTALPPCHPLTAATACVCPITINPLHCPTHSPELCPTHAPLLCPTHIPLHCPTHQPGVVCPPSPPPLLCPHTPLHGCPTPPVLCPTPTVLAQHCTQACPTNPAHCVTQTCPSVHIPCQTVPACPSGFVCGIQGGGFGGDPAAGRAGFVQHGGGFPSVPCPTAIPVCHITLPPACQISQPLGCHFSQVPVCHITQLPGCHITQAPVCLVTQDPICHVTQAPPLCHLTPFCPLTPACPSIHNFCPTNPAICQHPSVQVGCPTFPACPSALGCPSGPACGGGGPIGGGGGPVF